MGTNQQITIQDTAGHLMNLLVPDLAGSPVNITLPATDAILGPAYTLPTATNSVLGGVKPDGTSILNTAGVISATAASVGAAATSHTQAVSTISDSTTVGQNLVKLTNPGAINFVKIAADNTVSSETAANHLTSLGATTVGGNLVKLTNPGAITFPRFNANNTVDALSAADFKTAIGASSGGGDGAGGKYYTWLNFGGFMGGP